MLRKPYLYTDTVSFYNNNAPFEILHNNNILLAQLSENVILNKNLEQGFLFGKDVLTNGIKDYFYINKVSESNIIKISDFEKVELLPSKIYKTQNDVEITKHTPLTADEIVSYMNENGYITKQMVIKDVIYASNIPNSNLLNFEYAKQNGFLKNEDVYIESLNIKFDFKNASSNYIISIDFASRYFIKKNGVYSLNLKEDNISNIKTENVSLMSVHLEDYQYDNSDNYVSNLEFAKQIAPMKNENVKLFISSTSLNSPINKKTYLEKSNNFISLNDKVAYSIKINRAKEITNSDVLTIDEASTIIKDIIRKTTSLSFNTVDEFENFFNNICSNVEYLKKDLVINFDKGYVGSYFNNTNAIINHKSFKRLLLQTGKVDQDSYEVDKSSNYFNSILTTEERNSIIKLAQSIGVNIDFVKDKFGDIFNKLCSLVLKLSYPSPEDLKMILNIDYAKPIYVNSFIVINPGIQYVIKNMSKYIFYSPVYTKVSTTFIISNPKIYRVIKSNINYNFNSPIYFHIENDLNIINYTLRLASKNYQTYQFLTPKYINMCRFDDLLSINTIEKEAICIKARCQKQEVLKYSILSSNRAINGVELSFIYNVVLSSMDKNVYLCRECVVSKKLAALIISIYIIKGIVSKYEIPIDIELSKIVTKLYSQYLQTQSSQNISINDICNSSSSTQSSLIDSFIHTNSILLSTLDLDMQSCQASEIIKDFEIVIDEFVISDNFIDDAIDSVSDMVIEYYSKMSADKLNTNFVEFSSQTSCADYKIDKYIYNKSEVEYGKIDLRYTYDCFSKNEIGSRKNDYPCDNQILNNNLSYWVFLYIKGKYGNKPTNLYEQRKGLYSQTIGKLYFIDPDLINIETSVKIEKLQFFDKKEYGYIATIKELDSFIYYDEDEDVVKYIGNYDISVENGDDDDDGFYIKINNLKIYVNSVKNTGLKSIDTNVDEFDFSFIHELQLNNEYSLDIDALIGDGLQGMISNDYNSLPVYKVQTKISDYSIQFLNTMSSGADLKDKGSIASPICEYITNPENSFIPGHIKISIVVDAFMVSYENSRKIIKDIGATIPFSFGVIDGYFNDEAGELLSNATSKDEIDTLLNKYQFNVKQYISPELWYDFLSFYKINDKELIPENKIIVDIVKLVKNLQKINGDELYFVDMDETKKIVSEADICYGNKETENKPGVYVSGVNIKSETVYAKAVTKNKFMPLAILSSNDGFKITNITNEKDVDLYKDTSYVALNDMINLVSTIYLFKKPLYNNGIFMTFNQT